jgi:hypothetical protein
MLIDEIRALLAAPSPDDPRPILERMDATLTEGYAQALQLEAERWRIEQQIAEIIAGLAAETNKRKTAQLAALGRRRTVADEHIVSLRTLLALLRDRRAALRDAA